MYKANILCLNIHSHFFNYNRLSEIIASGLQDQEYVTVLTWIIQTYPGEELMQSWNLQVSPALIKPLLEAEDIEKLQQAYLDKLEGKF